MGAMSLKPTLKELVKAEVLLESQILFGEGLLEKPVSQVVNGMVNECRPGSLLVTKEEVPDSQEALSKLAGLVLVRPLAANHKMQRGAGTDAVVQKALTVCSQSLTPLLLLSGFGEPKEAAEEIRAAYLSEVKRASARLHGQFIRILIEEGLSGFVEYFAALVERPVVVETADFKVLASHNMGATPSGSQKILTEELAQELNRRLRFEAGLDLDMEPRRFGRRLVSPIILEGAVMGYLSVMVRPTDDISLITEYLRPATLACLVDFSQRRVSATNVTQKSLLKDLLSGHSLAASDQERLEQYFGFDICDGLLVFASRILPYDLAKALSWSEERQAVVEMEGTFVFVVPREDKQDKQEIAAHLKNAIKASLKDVKVQMGAGRLAQTLLSLPDSYREARQALIIGSMIYDENEFVIGYDELGIKRLLYLMIDHPELDRFYEEHLAPLEAYDAEWETDLVPTLRIYLEQGANVNSAAKELFVHRHTMRYRLEQIADLLKVDIDSPEVLLNLQIAFQIKDMKRKARA